MDHIQGANVDASAIGALFKDCSSPTAGDGTTITARHLNGVMMEIINVILKSGQTPIPFDAADPVSYDQLWQAFVASYRAGDALPTSDEGAIWHHDYNSLMTWQTLGGYTGYASIDVGKLIPFAGATPPAGYLLANGAELSRTSYAGLFGVIGETWGAGDGSTTFGLPDLRNRTVLGQDGNLGDYQAASTLAPEVFRRPSGSDLGLWIEMDNVEMAAEVTYATQDLAHAIVVDTQNNHLQWHLYPNADTHLREIFGIKPNAAYTNFIIKY